MLSSNNVDQTSSLRGANRNALAEEMDFFHVIGQVTRGPGRGNLRQGFVSLVSARLEDAQFQIQVAGEIVKAVRKRVHWIIPQRAGHKVRRLPEEIIRRDP